MGYPKRGRPRRRLHPSLQRRRAVRAVVTALPAVTPSYSVLPAVQVLLDDGTGTFPYDISAYARLPEGLVNTRGRQDENATVTASTLNLTLDNSDGRFTYGSVTYGCTIDQKIRLVEASGNRVTAYVQSWPVKWAPAGKQAFASITAVDAWARLSRFELRSMIEEEILLAGARAYYAMTDPTTAVAASDTSGNGYASMTIKTDEAGTASPTFTGTAVSFPADSDPLAVDLNAMFAGGSLSTASTFRTSFTISVAPSSSLSLLRMGADTVSAAGTIRVLVDSAGLISVRNGFLTTYYTGPNVADGQEHELALAIDGTTYKTYLDGTLVDTSTVTFTGTNSLRVGGVVGTYGCTMRNVGVFITALSAAQISNQYRALHGGDTSAARIARIAAICNVSTGTIDAGLSTLDFPDITGMNAADVLNEIAVAENGFLYINGSGQLRFINRSVRPLVTTAAFTADTATEVVGADVEVITDMADVVNYSTGKRIASAGLPQVALNQVSITAHGRYSRDLTTWVATDDEAHDRANWLVSNHAEPKPRIARLVLDLMTASSSDRAAILALDLGARIALANMPTQTPGTIGDLMIEGWTETLTDQTWTLELNTTAWSLNAAWILDSATYSVLDSTTKLAV